MSGRWVAATVIGSGLGGAVGLAASFAAGATVIQPWALLPFGVALGVCQWFVLRTQFAGSGWWTLAYALGLPLSFVIGLIASFSIGFEWENVDAIFRVVSLAFFGAVAGAVFGMLSGGLLVWFLHHPRRMPSWPRRSDLAVRRRLANEVQGMPPPGDRRGRRATRRSPD